MRFIKNATIRQPNCPPTLPADGFVYPLQNDKLCSEGQDRQGRTFSIGIAAIAATGRSPRHGVVSTHQKGPGAGMGELFKGGIRCCCQEEVAKDLKGPLLLGRTSNLGGG